MKTKIFEIENHKGRAVLRLKFDKLDTQVSPQLKAEFLIVCQSPLKKLIVDMTTVKSCDSSGLSALLVAERLMRELKGEIHLVIPNQDVRNLFKITQLEKVFSIHPTADAVS
ncbi:MAG TPA: STAS domain-containing protein [Candidatus Acidoferrales bacterium]|nr:STAS domain-containing protein [Candidatus Acidoferrales bacterium]